MKYILLVFTSALLIISCNNQNLSSAKADLIYTNAKIWTGDSANPSTSCIAVKDSVIIYVGNNADSFKGDKTELIDAGGKMIVPGFADNHVHFLMGGYHLAAVNLKYAKSKDEFKKILADYVSKLKDDRWIQGGDWDHESMNGELPTKEWIDSICGTHPVFMYRYDGHMALANSIALNLAGIDKSTASPAGGIILKDAKTGEPTGVLKDEAMNLVMKKIPDPSETELDEMVERATTYLLANGVTQIHDVNSYGGWIDLETYRRLHKANKLKLRIYSLVALNTWKKLDDYIKQNGRGDDMLQWGGLKGFVDGSLGSTTAWFYKPYLDNPSTGLNITDTNDLRKDILSADSAGLQVAVHAIGDRAIDFLLNVYEEAEKRNNNTNQRFRIEHTQHISKASVTRFAALNVIPSMQPYHAIDDGRWAYKRLEDDRLKRTYAFKTLLAANAKLCFGSDWTVAPAIPLEGIYAAVTRRTLDDKNPNGWYPEEKITVDQALRCYTVNNAYASFNENKTGMLKKGMLADFVLLSEDIRSIAPENINKVKVLQTFLNGKKVYQSENKP